MTAMCRDGSIVNTSLNTITVGGRGYTETYVLFEHLLTGPGGFVSWNCKDINEAFCMVCWMRGGKVC